MELIAAPDAHALPSFVGCAFPTLSMIAGRLGVEASKLSSVTVQELGRSIRDIYHLGDGRHTAKLSTWNLVDLARPVRDFSNSELFYEPKKKQILSHCYIDLAAVPSVASLAAAPPLYELAHPHKQTIGLHIFPEFPPVKNKRKGDNGKTEGGDKRRKLLLADGTTGTEVSSPEEAGTFPVVVNTLTGKSVNIQVKSSDTVRDLAEKIDRDFSIPPEQQRLIYAGRQLKHELLLAYYGIARESTIHLCLRLRGGMMHISSGRLDYVSVGHCTTNNHHDKGGDRVLAVGVSIFTGPGSRDCVDLYAHPNTPMQNILETLRMETEPNYFNEIPHSKLLELLNDEDFCARVSRVVLERASKALTKI